MECNACGFLAYAICEAVTALSFVFFGLFVAWAHVTAASSVSPRIDHSIDLLSLMFC
jgi:hypothetical protein